MMAIISGIDRIFLTLVCVSAFVSFVWATWAHFADTKERPLGTRLIFLMTPVGTLGTVATYLLMPVLGGFWMIGIILYATSLALFWWAIATTRIKQRLSIVFASDIPRFVVVSGPYRWIRHPFYLSYILFWLAGFAATGAWWLGLMFAGMTGVYWRAAATEENKFARSDVADEYTAYVTQTRKFIPGIV